VTLGTGAEVGNNLIDGHALTHLSVEAGDEVPKLATT